MAKLCLEWNRYDMAQTHLFSDEKLTLDRATSTSNIDQLMHTALLENRAEFIEIFLENDFDLKPFLTYRRLFTLYNQVILIV